MLSAVLKSVKPSSAPVGLNSARLSPGNENRQKTTIKPCPINTAHSHHASKPIISCSVRRFHTNCLSERPRGAHRTANSTSMSHTSAKVSDSTFHSSKHLILSNSLRVILNSLYTELISKHTMTNRFKRRSILPYLASMQVLLPTSSSSCLPNNECHFEFLNYTNTVFAFYRSNSSPPPSERLLLFQGGSPDG